MKFGKYNEDESVQYEATECALTGRDVSPENSIREHVKGTLYFVRIVGHQYHRVTDEDRATWEREAVALDRPLIVANPVERMSRNPKTIEVKE